MTGEQRPVPGVEPATAGSSPTVLRRLQQAKIVPVVVLDDHADADALADALVSGGITAIEVTLRTAAGLPAVARLAHRTDIVVGAGTVLNARQAVEAIECGARFIVSPGFTPDVVEATLDRSVLSMPGVATASELQQATSYGLSAVKLFPVELLGGIPLIKALSGPFPDMRFLPSGGITPDSAVDYLAVPEVFAIGGSWMVQRSLITGRRFDEVTRISRDTMNRSANRS